MKTTEEKLKAAGAVALLVLDCIRDTGTIGMPGGTLFASLMTFGCTQSQFDGLMSLLLESGKVEKRGDCYFAVVETVGVIDAPKWED